MNECEKITCVKFQEDTLFYYIKFNAEYSNKQLHTAYAVEGHF